MKGGVFTAYPVIFEDEAKAIVREAEQKKTGIILPSADGEIHYRKKMYNYDGWYESEWSENGDKSPFGMSSAQMAERVYAMCNKYGKEPFFTA